MNKNWPTFNDLVIAYKNCRIHKRSGPSQLRFESRLGVNLSLLFDEIIGDDYHPLPAKRFIVTDPKPREIFAANFRDRIVHHLVVSQLTPIWEKKFIHSSFACLTGKGPYGAIKFSQQKVRQLSRGGMIPVWVLQLDIEKFFITINRKILCSLLSNHCNHPKLLHLIKVIYEHDARIETKQGKNLISPNLISPGKSWFHQSPEQGIPIGNLTSQFGANVYLTALDHFIQRELKPMSYIRYMDDLLLLDTDPRKLSAMANPIDQWLSYHRNQQLNKNKTHLVPLSDGITYLGYHLQQSDSATEPLQIFSMAKKKWKWVSSLKNLEYELQQEDLFSSIYQKPHILAPFLPNSDITKKIASINSKAGMLHHSKSYRMRKYSMEKFIERTTFPQNFPEEMVDRWCYFKYKKDYQAIVLR